MHLQSWRRSSPAQSRAPRPGSAPATLWTQRRRVPTSAALRTRYKYVTCCSSLHNPVTQADTPHTFLLLDKITRLQVRRALHVFAATLQVVIVPVCVPHLPCLTRWMQVQGYVSMVCFTEACAAIPADVLLLEIGPHLVMRSPLRQSRPTLQCALTSCGPQLFITRRASQCCSRSRLIQCPF